MDSSSYWRSAPAALMMGAMAASDRSSLTLDLRPAGEVVPLTAFLQAMESLRKIVQAAGAAVSEPPLQWVIGDLATGSARVAVVPLGDLIVGTQATTLVGDSLSALENEQTIPGQASVQLVEGAKELASLTQKHRARVFVSIPGRRLEVTYRTELVARAWLEVPSLDQLGSVEGKLEMISIHGGHRFYVYDSSGQRIGAEFDVELLPAVVLALGKRVTVSGRVRYNRRGQPATVWAREVIVLPSEAELPSIEEMAGLAPDITGSLSSEQAVRRLRE